MNKLSGVLLGLTSLTGYGIYKYKKIEPVSEDEIIYTWLKIKKLNKQK